MSTATGKTRQAIAGPAAHSRPGNPPMEPPLHTVLSPGFVLVWFGMGSATGTSCKSEAFGPQAMLPIQVMF